MATCTSTEEGNQSLHHLLMSYIKCAESFTQICQDFANVKGAKKLERMCQAELKFLLSLKNKFPYVQESQLKSSNLSHFAGILHSARTVSDITSLQKPFTCPGRPENLVVDVVAAQDQIWVKVIARKAQALHLIWAGKGQFGERDLLKQAEDYLICASGHPVNFTAPQVHFVFYNQVTHEMAETLEELGVNVWGDRVDVDSEVLEKIQNIDSLFEDEDSPQDDDDDDDDDDDEEELQINSKESSSGDVNCLTCNDDNENETQKYNFVLGSDVSNDTNLTKETSAKVPDLGPHLCSDISENRKQIPDKQNILPDIFANHDFILSIVISFPDLRLLGQKVQTSLNSSISKHEKTRPKVNLDISTLINLVSSVTHGGNNFIFKDEVLTLQASEERQSPALPDILKFLEGKELLVCQTALSDFQTILNLLGGTNEKRRADELLQRIQIVSDQPSERALQLPETAKIKHQSKIVFGTGDQLKAITTTSNSGFIRAAEHKGVSFAVYRHPPRSLTEQKEKFATKISDDGTVLKDGSENDIK